jgi:outer membrane receptor protein involved in Fe transport
MVRNSYLFLLLIFILTASALSQSEKDSMVTYQSEDSILVVANRYQVSAKALTYNYKLITEDKIQSMSSHSALEMVDFSFPSAFVLEKNTMGFGVGEAGAGQVNIRGLGGKPNTGVLVLLNGHPDFMGIFGHPLPDVYGIDDIQRVEVLAGPASTVFGNHALGGVVNLVTEPDYQHLAKLSIEGGAYNSYNLGINLAKRFGSNGFYLNARRKKSDGHIPMTSFESVQLNGGWSMQINPALDLAVRGRYVPYKFDDPERGNYNPAGLGIYGKIERGMGEIILNNDFHSLKGSAQVYTNFGHHRFYDGFESNDFNYGISLYQNWLAGSNYSFAFGTDFMQFGGQAENPFARKPNGDPVVNEDRHEISSSGTYAQVLYNPFNNVNLKGGMRYQYNSLEMTNLSPMAGISYTPFSSLQLFANYQNGFRNPTPMELYLFPSANENLEPEEINSIEGGAAFQWAQNNRLSISYYNNRVKNIIDNYNTMKFTNSGSASQWGIESQLQFQLAPGLGTQFSYSYLEPDIITSYNPEHQFKYMLFTGRQKYRISIFGKFVSGLFANNYSENPLNDYHIMNVSITLFSDLFNTHLKVLNIFNRKYEIAPDYKAPGTNAQIGVDFKL